MKHALIRGMIGSDQFIGIDGRFGDWKIRQTIHKEIQNRLKILPNFDTFIADVYRGPRIGEGGIVMTVTVQKSQISP